jgi:Na+/H+ antiporter
MEHLLIEYIYLILAILMLVMVANRLKIAYPIVLVIGGLGLSFFSAFSKITINPELVFFIFLPPLLYEAAWNVSWKEFWKWKRVIMSFAFPVVIVTATVVALVSNWLIPGFTLALGFLLGGIVSPPDAVSASTVMRQVNAPKRLVSIAEGESLLNDASSLIVFRFALAAIITGQFNFGEASISFLLVVLMGIAIGIAVGFVFYAIHRWLPVTPAIEIVLTLVTPYCMYYFAEYFHFSGVLAVVSGGLLLSFRRQSMLNYMSRIQGVNVWTSLIFLLNGLVFMLIGLQLPSIVNQLGDISIYTATWYGLAISLTLIITRLFCALFASVFTTFMSNFITVADAHPGWKGPLVLGWAGMRGVVSLAAALSIPLLADSTHAFPYRNLILYITFIVILVTLVLQGLTLPWLVRRLDIHLKDNPMTEYEQERIIQKKLAHYSLEFLEAKYGNDWDHNEHLQNLRSKLETELKFFSEEIEDANVSHASLKDFQVVYLEMLDHQRAVLDKINHKAEFDEDLVRKYFALVDLEEFKVREKTIGSNL